MKQHEIGGHPAVVRFHDDRLVIKIEVLDEDATSDERRRRVCAIYNDLVERGLIKQVNR